MLEFEKIETEKQIKDLATLANEIWHEYFICIITEEQIDYMVEKFQSYTAMSKQIEDGYIYYIAKDNGQAVGYMGMTPEEEKMFLSKLYLKKDARGKGYASLMLSFIENICLEKGLNSIYLTVNRYNEHTINVYRRKGFSVVKEQKADIGNGYFMDDYVMEKKINIHSESCK